MNGHLCTVLLALLAGSIAVPSCSKQGEARPQDAEQPGAIGFDTYTLRATKAGTAGVLTTDALKTGDMKDDGFGVFAYYTDNRLYSRSGIPNLMYNQQVKWDAGDSRFAYTPVVYWPNEYGSTAVSDDCDRVSFFAYAPYVPVTPSTGLVRDGSADSGIFALSRNSENGDPLVYYRAGLDAGSQVDLCWAVFNEADPWAVIGSGTQALSAGLPWLNVRHPATVDQTLKLSFLHATAQLSVTVDAVLDQGGLADLPTETRIWVRSIRFTGVASEGCLNLNNTASGTPLWMNVSGSGWIPRGGGITVYDGLMDGAEGEASAEDPAESLRGFNPVVIGDPGNTQDGVTTTAVPLFAAGTLNVIPTGERMDITIEYDVETATDELQAYLSDGVTHGVSVGNRITTTGVFPALEGGKNYTLRLHLGMRSVGFIATVEAWDTTANSATVELPEQETI